MDERLDAILSDYEELWRGAALSAAPRLRDGGQCAMTVADAYPRLFRPLLDIPSPCWTCSECGQRKAYIVGAAIHLFDIHEWTWDMFANKFRDALAEGMTP